MENAAAISANLPVGRFRYLVGMDTKLVLFFLAMETGRGQVSLDPNGFLLFVTLALFVVLPYFLPVPIEKPEFWEWMVPQLIVVMMGFILGAALNVVSEAFLMENLRFMPMFFLIFTGILCAATQIRGIIGVRLAS